MISNKPLAKERFKYIACITNNTMSDVVVSVRVDESVHDQMKAHDEINWSAVVRKSITEKLANTHVIDTARARRAVLIMDELRSKNILSSGKNSVELIREWRQKRK